MNPGGVKDGNWEYDVDCLGGLRLDPDSSVMLFCDVIVPFPAANNESQTVSYVGPMSPPAWHHKGHFGGTNTATVHTGGRAERRSGVTKRGLGPERSQTSFSANTQR